MKIIIIGAGASGMIGAILLARRGHEVVILELDSVCGRKLAMTGNGRCNFTNLNIDRHSYYDNSFASTIVEFYDPKKCIEFYNSIGVETFINGDYVYPKSEQASSVVEALLLELQLLNVKIYNNAIIKKIECDKQYKLSADVNDKLQLFISDKLVLAIGSIISTSKYLQESIKNNYIYKFIESNFKFNAYLPALSPLSTCDSITKARGVRVKCNVSLVLNNGSTYNEYGEVQINDNSLSGFPIMQLSRIAYKNGIKNTVLYMHFFDEEFFENRLNFYLKNKSNISIDKLFLGILNKKLVYVLLNKARIKENTLIKDLNNKDIDILIKIVTNTKILLEDKVNFNNAQCCTGGIDLSCIDKNTMRLITKDGISNIYATGELLDVDGRCGGYNLHFAFASAAYMSEKGEFFD